MYRTFIASRVLCVA